MSLAATEPHALPEGKIAYLTGEYPRATDTFIQREVAALRALGIEITTCSVRKTDARHHVGESQRSEAARTFYVQSAAKNPLTLVSALWAALSHSPGRWLSALTLAWRTRPPGAKALLWQIFYFLEAAVLVRHLRANGVVHLHNHFANSSCSVAMIASEMSGIPFSFTLHGPAIFFEPKWWRLDEKIAHARFVACISHFARSQAMLFSDQRHWDKLKIIHCGVDPAAYARRDGPRGKRVLFVGRLAAIKGVPLLLRAFTAVAKDHPDAYLTIIGDGPDRAALEVEAAAAGISGRVAFLGYQPQEAVAAQLAQSDMMMLPSFAEGVPVVLMEAMATGLPVIASRVAGVPELVEDGVSGFLVPPGDLGALTERLGLLMADQALRERMGVQGRIKVAAEFDGTHEATRLASLLAGRATASARESTGAAAHARTGEASAAGTDAAEDA